MQAVHSESDSFALVIHDSSFDLGVAEDEAGVGPRSGQGGSAEGQEVDSVLVLSEEAFVVECHGQQEDGSRANHDVGAAFLVEDMPGVSSAKLKGVLLHSDLIIIIMEGLNYSKWHQLADLYDYFIFDCDGVLWVGPQSITGSFEALDYLLERKKKVFLLTNAS